MGNKISDVLYVRLPIVFDGSTTNATHLVSLFTTFTSDAEKGYPSVLLPFSPFEDESSQRTVEQYQLLQYVLNLFGKSLLTFVAFIGGTFATNKSFARMEEVGFVRCEIHCFDIAFQDILLKQDNFFEDISFSEV